MFELQINKQHLLTPLLTVAGAVDKKQSLAILSNILLKIANNTLSLTATDLEIEIAARVECVAPDMAGAVTVPAKKMVDIIRSLEENATPTIAFNANVVSIKEGRSHFKLTTLPADNFPNSEQEAAEAEFYIEREPFLNLLQSVQFAIAQQDVRVFLNGLLLEIEQSQITAVAMDGHRMAIGRLAGQSNQSYRLLIPRKGIQEVLRLLNNVADEKILLAANKRQFKLETQQYTFSTKLIEAKFPAYARAIPREQNKLVLIDRDLLKRALSRIIILAHEKSRAVQLHIQENLLTLIANNQEQEEAIESLPAETQGEELKIGLNASYLLDVLNHISEGILRLSFSNSDSSVLIESVKDESFFYIIMPMKI